MAKQMKRLDSKMAFYDMNLKYLVMAAAVNPQIRPMRVEQDVRYKNDKAVSE